MKKTMALSKLAFLMIVFCSQNVMATETQSNGDPKSTNFPTDAEGRVYHLGLKRREVANQVLLVGDPNRARLICTQLDDPQKVFTYASNRGFTTYTGTKIGETKPLFMTPLTITVVSFFACYCFYCSRLIVKYHIHIKTK